MATGFTVDDSKFMAGLSGYVARARTETQAGMRRYGDSVVTFARAHISSKSGELAGALKVDEHFNEGDEPYLEVGAFEDGAADPHGLYTEFGTSKETARPFIRPALEEASRDFTVEL
jgi:hypothetical protein